MPYEQVTHVGTLRHRGAGDGMPYTASPMSSSVSVVPGCARIPRRAPMSRSIWMSRTFGGADKLRDFPAVTVAEMDFLLNAAAIRRYGSSVTGSVIIVKRK